MLANRIMSEHGGIESASFIRRTLKIHEVVRMFDNSQSYLKFFSWLAMMNLFLFRNMLQNSQERFLFLVIKKLEQTTTIAGFAKIASK